MDAQIATLLQNSLSADPALRSTATDQLDQLLVQSHAGYVLALSSLLSNCEQDATVRTSAGLALKNTLTSRDYSKQIELSDRWKGLPEDLRSTVKTQSLQGLGDSLRTVRGSVGQVVAAIAAIEVPVGMWPQLISTLLEGINGAQSSESNHLRQSTLQALGWVCEQVNPDILASHRNEILTAVVHGARKEEPSADVQLAAMSALYNSLEFVRENFETEGERNYIMQVVCEATQIPNADVQVAAFECLVKVMQLYYEKMKFYMERALFGLTVLGMKHEDDRVALQAVEFWSTVCDEEIELALELEEATEYGDSPERTSYSFARVALPEILPVLLQLLSRQEEDATEDEWNISMAAGTCLGLLAQVTGDVIVAPIIPFVESHIKNPDWRQREAAIMAFGSILDGPNASILTPLVNQALPVLIEMMRDSNSHVKDTTAWTLGRICDFLIETISVEIHLPGLVHALVSVLEQSSATEGEARVVSNTCWALMNLVEQLSGSSKETSPMSQYYEGIATALFKFSERVQNESNCRDSAYEALSSLVSNAPNDRVELVSKLVIGIIERSENLLKLHDQIVGADDRQNWNQMQINCCCVLTACVRRIGKDIKPLSDRIMTLLLQLLQTSGRSSPVQEDVFLAIGSVTGALEQDFHPYLSAFAPFLISALENHEDYQLCAIAVGLIGDICRALGDQATQYCQGFLEVLMQDLQSAVLHRSVKPPILSCFGDVAMAIGANYEPYLEATMGVLTQAGAMRADPNNFDLVEYINTLREGILEAYIGITGGLKAAGKADALLPFMPGIFTFLHLALSDQDRPEPILASSIGLIGDLAEAFPNGQLKDILSSQWVEQSLKTGRTRLSDTNKKKVAKWAREMVRRASQ